jgi:hypothetical protein
MLQAFNFYYNILVSNPSLSTHVLSLSFLFIYGSYVGILLICIHVTLDYNFPQIKLHMSMFMFGSIYNWGTKKECLTF